MKRCFMWDAAQPFVISHLDYCNSHQAGLVKYSVQQLQTIQNAAACPVCNLPKFSFVASPRVLPPSLPAGCRWLFTSHSEFWSWHSRLLRESHARIWRLWSIRTLQPALCYNRPLSSPLPAAATSSFHLALTLPSTVPQQWNVLPTPGGTAQLLHIFYCQKKSLCPLNIPISQILALHLLFGKHPLYLFTFLFLFLAYLLSDTITSGSQEYFVICCVHVCDNGIS